ncbi:MAG: DNA-binding protein [Armatimonadetes bacterium CG07_land_8_20_14_0_80_40_9]|nr:MAG: DNA-binding protein [Armatimonadetes bacterium CG07_land_8_20_14_0_80_40_9]
MSEWMEEVEEMVYPGRIKVPYKWSVGEYGSHFFIELRDNKKIWGTKCPKCKIVFVPPRNVCPRCFTKIEEWVELGSEGTLLTYTVVHYKSPVSPLEPPYGYGIIKLEGADTGLTHLLSEMDFEKIKIGMKVRAVFKEKREGNILDIKYFKPV